MPSPLHDFREGLLLRDSDAYAEWHRGKVAQQRRKGVRVTAGMAADNSPPLVAYVNHGRWLVDCPCGSGAYVDPMAEVARCAGQGCGLVSRVLLPPVSDRSEIERLLLARRRPPERNWRHPETIDDLRRENEAHGVAV